MKTLLIRGLLAAVLPWVAIAEAEQSRPILLDGIVHYTGIDGQRKRVSVGERCSDLWVASDESVLAFITINKAFPGTERGESPFVEESSIYTAFRSDNYKPVRVDLKEITLGGVAWKVFRTPSISPDRRILYFSVPYTQKDRKLFQMKLPGGRPDEVADVISYCVLWGGAYSGDLLLFRSVYEPINEGLGCFLKVGTGAETILKGRECLAFDVFAQQWAHDHGGTCRVTIDAR